MFIAIAIIAIVVLAIIWNKLTNKSLYKFPKGPQGWPILGNLFQLTKTPHLKLTKWGEQFGNWYTISLATKKALVVNDPVLLRELFGHSPANGKFKSEVMLGISQGPYGMLNREGKAWSEQKHFCVKTLLNFGLASSKSESTIVEEIKEFRDWVEKESSSNGGEVIFSDAYRQALNNVIWFIISGEKIEFEDDTVARLQQDYLYGINRTINSGLMFIPWLKYIAPEWSGHIAFERTCKNIHQFIRETYEKHKRTIVEGSPRDVLDAYIEQVRTTTDTNSTFYGEVGKSNSLSTLAEVFIGGGDTSSEVMTWLLYFLCCYPEVQKKLCREIDVVVGQERDPSLLDKRRMPYTDAVIHEALRFASFTPMGVIHELTDDFQFREYFLPKGLILIPNLYACHYSKNIWGDPNEFRPERFLENPSLKESVVAFQPGKRGCPGEPVAKDVMFMFTTMLFQKWQASPIPGLSREQYLQPDAGFVLMPKRLGVNVNKRVKFNVEN